MTSVHGWISTHTGQTMPVVRHGDRGFPLIYVPSSGGDEREFEAYRLPEVCAPWLGCGAIQVFSVDGCARRHLWNDTLAPAERIRGYAAFERYLIEELVPWVCSLAAVERVGVVGASYGAQAAANLVFKHPLRIDVACGLGGVYGLWHRLDGYHDDEVYFHTPLEYLPRLDDERILAEIRSTRGIALFAAQNDEWLSSTLRLSALLRAKRLPQLLDVWPAPADHHERWWRRQLPRFLDSFYGRGSSD